MNIITQHNIDDEVYLMYENQIQTGTVRHISTSSSLNSFSTLTTTVKYDLNSTIESVRTDSWLGDKLFSSKQELLDSL